MIKKMFTALFLVSAILVGGEDPKSKTITCVVSGDEINKSDLKDHEHSTYKAVSYTHLTLPTILLV